MLEQQAMTIQSMATDEQVIKGLDEAQKLISGMQKNANIDKLDDLQADMAETDAINEEMAEFFQNAAAMDDQDELMDELNELEAEVEI